jgi:colanic acid/amylovoran biosynthesis protein
MRIVLIYAGNSLNYGAFMMTANLIAYINDRVKECHFFVGANSPKDIQRIKAETAITTISSFDGKVIRPTTFFGKIASIIHKLFFDNKTKLRHKPDSIIVLGGDDLSEYYEHWRISFDLINLKKLSKRTKLFLVGQTIGPFHSFRKYLAHLYLKNIPIYTRDPNNTKYLVHELKLDHVIESSDLAFLDMVMQDHQSYSLKEYNLAENEYITIVPSGLVEKYASDKKTYLNEWIKIVDYVLKKFNSKKIVLLAHVLYPENVDDRPIINAISEAIKSQRIISITGEILASKARFILGHGYLTISGRMHGAISTFQMGKPAISLSYSVKYNGILGKDLGLEELVIEAKGDAHWNSGNISELINEKIDYIEMNYFNLTMFIREKVIRLKEKALIQIDDIVYNLLSKSMYEPWQAPAPDSATNCGELTGRN